jgi:hypothetical protein
MTDQNHSRPQPPSRPDRPLLLIDIDGVLNAFDARRLDRHQHQAQAGAYVVVLDRRHPAWFRTLAEHAELRWATMWQAQAASIFGSVADIGTDWPYLDFDSVWMHRTVGRTGVGVGGYKWPLIEQCGESGRPLVWIDDDMTDRHIAWAQRRDAEGIPTMFIRPDPARGFTEDEYAAVLGFVRETTGPQRNRRFRRTRRA